MAPCPAKPEYPSKSAIVAVCPWQGQFARSVVPIHFYKLKPWVVFISPLHCRFASPATKPGFLYAIRFPDHIHPHTKTKITMHSQSPSFALRETEYYTLGLHIPQQTRPAVPAPISSPVSVPASANVSIQISYPPSGGPAPPPAPPPSLQQIKSCTPTISRALYTNVSLGHNPPFATFRPRASNGRHADVAAVVGRDRTGADGAVRAAAGMDGGMGKWRSATTGWSGFPATLGRDDS